MPPSEHMGSFKHSFIILEPELHIGKIILPSIVKVTHYLFPIIYVSVGLVKYILLKSLMRIWCFHFC